MLLLGLTFTACEEEQETIQSTHPKIFESIPSSQTGIDFINILEEDLESNYYQYMYTYIGGGVAAGDINNDGFTDLFFTANSSENKLFLNKGDFTFEDITLAAGLQEHVGFHTGTTMVDIDHDGYLDIYICRGGWKNDEGQFANLLYINNGDLTFTERAAEHGLADANRGIQATFFDYDRDQDLDVYISNTPDITGRAQVLDLDSVQSDPRTLQLLGSDRLYQNDGTGHFHDVSEAAGLHYDIGFGLNPQIMDLNEDGWLDIYVCNDFNGPDLAYLNNQQGAFQESRDILFKHMSFNSMGSDAADVNNDGRIDLMTLDMNPEDYVRSKTTMAMTSIPVFESMVEQGYHYQYMHNMLQLNRGNGLFSEISKMAGIGDTDWSWALLSADFNLDGYNDVFVTNGVYRDVIDRDKNNEILEILRTNQRKPTAEDFLQFAQMLPQQKLNNYLFANKGDLTFENVSTSWADSALSFSNGAVYADLDNDGDLDLVVNNINEPAHILRNDVTTREGKYLSITFQGPKTNPFGIGVLVKAYQNNGEVQVRRLINTRGFLSSVAPRMHFGFRAGIAINVLEVTWTDGKTQKVSNPALDQHLMVNYEDAQPADVADSIEKDGQTLFSTSNFDYRHVDPYFNDYELQILLPHKLSQTGPAVAKADVNGDHLTDIYLGGGSGQAGQLLLGSESGNFNPMSIADFVSDQYFEDQGACFFDADGDGDVDLYVSSGSYEYYFQPQFLIDRLYLGDGMGNFSRSPEAIPEITSSGSVVSASDWDADGDLDLFVGGRVIPGEYPYAPASHLLQNDGGTFSDMTATISPDLAHIGMVTDASWSDINQDGQTDLVLAGEWMGIEIFENSGNQTLVQSEAYPILKKSTGWWNKILVEDIDADGDPDIVAGNLGLNYKFHASHDKPFKVYTSDFDYDGIKDVVLAKEYGDREVPVRGKTCMTQQIPHLANKIPTYQEFASSDLEDIVGNLEKALLHEATEFRSGVFINTTGNFTFEPFGNSMQISPINSILFEDFSGDGHKDLLLAGNNFMSEVETTRADAGIGSFLQGNGKGEFHQVTHQESGFIANKDVRHLIAAKENQKWWVLVVNNNNVHDLFEILPPQI